MRGAPGRSSRRATSAVAALVVTLGACAAAPARADTPTAAEPPSTSTPSTGSAGSTASSEPVQGPAGPEERRDPAHYRGRRNDPPPEEVLAWIPRVLFAPLAVVTEMVIRRPLTALAAWAEENRVVEAIDLILNPDPNVTWRPRLSFEIGVLALPGFGVEWRNFPFEGNQIEVEFAMGSTEFYAYSFTDRVRLGPAEFGIRGGASSRPERPFYGLGPDSGRFRTYYEERHTELFGFLSLTHQHHVRADLEVGWSLEEASPGITPSIERILPLDQIPGFGLYELGVINLGLTLDTRRSVHENGGVRFQGRSTFAIDSRDNSRFFMTAELDFEAGVEVMEPDRVLVGRIYAMNTLPFGDEPVPFMRLAWLGHEKHRGFIWGRFRGEAAISGEVRYRYPISYFVDMIWLTSVGNVFDRDVANFDVGALTASFGVGLRMRRFLGTPIEATFSLGSSRFDAPGGFAIHSARFFLETRYGL